MAFQLRNRTRPLVRDNTSKYELSRGAISGLGDLALQYMKHKAGQRTNTLNSVLAQYGGDDGVLSQEEFQQAVDGNGINEDVAGFLYGDNGADYGRFQNSATRLGVIPQSMKNARDIRQQEASIANTQGNTSNAKAANAREEALQSGKLAYQKQQEALAKLNIDFKTAADPLNLAGKQQDLVMGAQNIAQNQANLNSQQKTKDDTEAAFLYSSQVFGDAADSVLGSAFTQATQGRESELQRFRAQHSQDLLPVAGEIEELKGQIARAKKRSETGSSLPSSAEVLTKLEAQLSAKEAQHSDLTAKKKREFLKFERDSAKSLEQYKVALQDSSEGLRKSIPHIANGTLGFEQAVKMFSAADGKGKLTNKLVKNLQTRLFGKKDNGPELIGMVDDIVKNGDFNKRQNGDDADPLVGGDARAKSTLLLALNDPQIANAMSGMNQGQQHSFMLNLANSTRFSDQVMPAGVAAAIAKFGPMTAEHWEDLKPHLSRYNGDPESQANFSEAVMGYMIKNPEDEIDDAVGHVSQFAN